jgi:carbonic anhydrase
LGIYFDTSAGDIDNAFISSLELSEVGVEIEDIPLKKLLLGLRKNKFYTYQGSLTTPPCLEAVRFYIVDDPQPISEE